MKKLILLIAALCITLLLTACESEYSGSVTDAYENDTSTEDVSNENGSSVAEEDTPGVYTEPLAGALITYPDILTYKTDNYGQYGKGVTLTDTEGIPTVELDIMVDEIYASRIDDAYEKFGFSGGMSDSKLMAYTENYFMVFTESQFFDTTSYSYDWVCLLTDGSVLHLALTAEQNDPVMLVKEISIDFTGAEGEIGLASIHDLPQYEDNFPVTGIWKNAESGYWFNCSGGLLFSIYDEKGNMIDCGTYDSLFECLTGYEQSYSVYVDDSGLNIQGFDGVFLPEQKLGIIPGNIPGGIPCEGTQAGETSGELSDFRGKWENDTISCSVEINRGGINVYVNNGYDGYSHDSYTVTAEGELALSDGSLVRIQDDGGLMLDGYEGVFYRAGTRESVYAQYAGQWHNDVTGQSMQLNDGGGYNSSSGFSVWSVTGKGKLNIGNDSAYIDENGNLVIDGYDDVFIMQAE